MSAPTMTREALRIISCPSSFFRGPPRSGIDRSAVFSEFNVKRWSVCFQRQCGCACHSFLSHRGNRFTREDELSLSRIHFIHASQDNVISVPDIEDDHLAVASEG